MPVRDYDPREGQAFQGDVAIIPMPPDIEIAITDEIEPVMGRLIIQEGEATGHHHAIEVERQRVRFFRRPAEVVPVIGFRDGRLGRTFGGGRGHGTARLYRDPNAIEELIDCGILTRIDLAIGCLIVAAGTAVLSHEEHDGIRLPPGNYYVGRQAESVGDKERLVTD